MASGLFYILAVLILFCAARMVFSKNLVHGVLYMVAVFAGIAFVYVLLQADYLAVVQILIYIGAVSVMFVFGVMLTKREKMEASSPMNRYGIFAGIAAVAALLLIGRLITMTVFSPGAAAEAGSTILPISSLLLNDFVIAFEVSGLLLLVALIGAIILGKGVNRRE